jgi:cytochrome c
MERDMFDTMTITKAVAGVCTALLIFLFGKWSAESLYGGAAEAHGEEHAQAYVIPVEDAGADSIGGEAVEEGPDFATLYASADAAAGEGLWRNCRACHSLEAGKNGTGPSLHGIVGRTVDAAEGYSYSGALEAVYDVWSPEHLDAFLTDPKGAAPGTKMTFKGISKAEDRANLIAYLATQG